MHATDGDDELGGSDLDICLANYISGRLASADAQEEGQGIVTILSGSGRGSGDLADVDVVSSAEVRSAAESAKKALSYTDVVAVSVVKVKSAFAGEKKTVTGMENAESTGGTTGGGAALGDKATLVVGEMERADDDDETVLTTVSVTRAQFEEV